MKINKQRSVMRSASVVTGLVLGALVLPSCTTDPYTGEQKVSKAAIGAAAGAVVGAATSSKSDRKKGAVIGAAVGGGAGFYFDEQERKLRARLQGTGVSVTRSDAGLFLNMPGNLTFQVNSANIRPDFYDVLESVTLVFKEYSKTRIKISGHTDSTGSDAYNQTLSEQRASSVMRYFIAKGLPADRFYAVGYGESRPVADNSTEAGRQANRRVEIEIAPME